MRRPGGGISGYGGWAAGPQSASAEGKSGDLCRVITVGLRLTLMGNPLFLQASGRTISCASARVLIRTEYRSEVLFEMQSVKELTRAAFFYSSSRNTRDFNHEIRAQSEIWLHREYNLAMKNKSLSYTMLHWSIVTHA